MLEYNQKVKKVDLDLEDIMDHKIYQKLQFFKPKIMNISWREEQAWGDSGCVRSFLDYIHSWPQYTQFRLYLDWVEEICLHPFGTSHSNTNPHLFNFWLSNPQNHTYS